MAQVYAMSDIHGCLEAFEESLSLIDLSGENKLILCGDYIHGGGNDYAVLDKVMELENLYGKDKIIVLAGNHEDMVCEGHGTITEESPLASSLTEQDNKYIVWLKKLRRYYVLGTTIFVHAGILEEAEELWEVGTPDYLFTEKYPAELGKFSLNIVAGHIGSETISRNPNFHDIYYDGESHYYIDGTVLESGVIPVLKLDTTTNQFYSVSKTKEELILPYNKLK